VVAVAPSVQQDIRVVEVEVPLHHHQFQLLDSTYFLGVEMAELDF
jgi:hypothetical protein